MVRKKEFIDRLSQKGYSKERAAIIMGDCISVMEEALTNGESVAFRGFGAFEIRNRVGKKTLSPQTKEFINVPPYKTVHFTPGKVLKREIRTGVLEH